MYVGWIPQCSKLTFFFFYVCVNVLHVFIKPHAVTVQFNTLSVQSADNSEHFPLYKSLQNTNFTSNSAESDLWLPTLLSNL